MTHMIPSQHFRTNVALGMLSIVGGGLLGATLSFVAHAQVEMPVLRSEANFEYCLYEITRVFGTMECDSNHADLGSTDIVCVKCPMNNTVDCIRLNQGSRATSVPDGCEVEIKTHGKSICQECPAGEPPGKIRVLTITKVK